MADELLPRVSSPRQIRQSNAARALRALYRFGRLSRAELARKMGVNRSSAGQIIAELMEAGLVREIRDADAADAGPARAGRPGIMLELVADAACFVAAEIGVEHITTVAIDLKTSIHRCVVEPFDGPDTPVESAVERAVGQAFADLPARWRERCEGFGLSIPAKLDAHGHVTVAPLLGWTDVDLKPLVSRTLPVEVPVLVENEANAFAIGEGYARGDGRSGVTMFLVIETGVGGGIVADGALFRGGRGVAGEIGHMQLPTGDGGSAEVERLIGLEPLLNAYRTTGRGAGAGLPEFLADVRDREPNAVSVADDWARHLGKTLVQVCHLIDPDRIVLGGSVAALYPMVAARVRQYMRDDQAPTFLLPDIVLDESAESGSAFGAACMLHEQFLSLESTRRRPAEPAGLEARA